MDKLVVLAAIVAVILFALVACGLVALFFLSAPAAPEQPSAPQVPAAPVTANQTVATTNESGAISAEDFALWQSITNDNVEAACYQKAQQEAGSDSWAVRGCTCKETATPEEKSYQCTINTAIQQGTYFAEVDCGLQARSCLVTTNFGSQNVSFDQLRQLYQGG
jgi:hypothetical protein